MISSIEEESSSAAEATVCTLVDASSEAAATVADCWVVCSAVADMAVAEFCIWVDAEAIELTMPPPRDTEDAVAPRSATETAIAAIWAALIESDAVSVTANFFAVGGHSLLATQLVTRLRERFGAEMPLRIVFERPPPPPPVSE